MTEKEKSKEKGSEKAKEKAGRKCPSCGREITPKNNIIHFKRPGGEDGTRCDHCFVEESTRPANGKGAKMPKETRQIWERAKEGLIKLCRDINRNYFEIGKNLFEINRDKLWAAEYASLEEFVEKVLEFRKSKAYQLIQIYEVFGKDFGYTAETLQEKNWTKLRGLLRLHKDGLLTKKNVKEWMDKIGDLRGDDFDRTIALALGKTDPKEVAQTRLIFVAENPEQASVITGAVDHMMRVIGGGVGRTAALECICADYMAGADPENPQAPERILAMAQKILESMKPEEGVAGATDDSKKAEKGAGAGKPF
jgi:predicted RNA-binding Zn-ribbon protein involved in translation (DUF1610 family)